MSEKVLKIEDGTEVITKSQYRGKDFTSVILPDSVKIIEDFAFKDCRNLKLINLPNGLVSIGTGAFFRCSSLIKITLPDTLKTIGFAAFKRTGIKSVVIPKSVNEIGDSAFRLSKLEEVSILSNIRKMGEGIFRDCSNLEKVTLSEKLKTIAEGMFHYTGIKEITIPDSVIKIGESAFEECNKLNVIYWSKNLKSIGKKAFCNTAVDNLVLSESVTQIDALAFHDCNSIEKIELSSENTALSYNDGILINKRGLMVYNTNKKVVKFPKNQKIIDSVPNAKKVEEIYIPDKVKAIDINELSNCIKLKSIYVDENNTKFCTDEYGILYDKKKTKILFVPPMIKELEEYIVPETIKTICKYSFIYNKGIKKISIPESVEIEEEAFICADFLETVDGVTYADKIVYSVDVKDCGGIIKFREGTICCVKNWCYDYYDLEEWAEEYDLDYEDAFDYDYFECIEELWIPSSMKSFDTTSLKYHFRSRIGLKKMFFTKNNDVYELGEDDLEIFEPQFGNEKLQKAIFNFLSETDTEKAEEIWKKKRLNRYLTKI